MCPFFPLKMLGDMDIYPLCQSSLQNKERSLAETAKTEGHVTSKETSFCSTRQAINKKIERIKSSLLLIAQHISPRLFQQLHCHPSVDTRTKRAGSDSPTQL